MKAMKVFLSGVITALLSASQPMAQEHVKVHTEGLTAKIKFEACCPVISLSSMANTN